MYIQFQAPSVNFIKKKSIELKKITYRKSPGVPELEVNTKQRTFMSHLVGLSYFANPQRVIADSANFCIKCSLNPISCNGFVKLLEKT